MRNSIRESRELKAGKLKNSKQSLHRRAVLPLPADAVDAAFADGVEIELATEASDNESLTYEEVVTKVSDQLRRLEDHRKQLHQLLEEAGESLRELK